MESMLLKEAAEAVNGKIKNSDGNIEFNGVVNDSRNGGKGLIFAALSGEKNNGHDFVEKAEKMGCTAALVSEERDFKIPLIVVDDTLSALRKLAKYYRKKFDIPVIAVTGSCGKTSTREMIAAVLERNFNVHRTLKNLNSEVGLPLTLFNLNRNYDISVIELGMNHRGEIKRLADMARPNVAVITNIGTAHIENLGSRDEIFKEKMDIVSYFKRDDLLIVNGDDDYLKSVKSDCIVKKVSLKGNGDYNALDIVNLGEDGVEFTAVYRDKEYRFRINVPGMHNVYNALYGIAAADFFNINIEYVIEGIAAFKPIDMRMNIINSKNGYKIINDVYNANLDSMKAAIDVLYTMKGKRKIAVLGDMFELGEYSKDVHRQVGKHLIGRCDILVAVGCDAFYYYDEAKNYLEAHYASNKNEGIEILRSIIKEEDVILIKGSRGMAMEDITSSLTYDKR